MQKAIVKTLVYADLFDYPLTAREIHQRLHHKKADLESVEFGLNQLLNQGKIKKQDKYYFLPGREKTVRFRKKRNKIAARKTKRAEKLARVIKIIPMIKLVGLTGSVAAENPRQEDDLDFLIITARGWLWTTRFLTTGLLSVLGLRRKPGDRKYKNKICLNLFLEEDNLSKFNQNLFTANEILNLKLLWDKNNQYDKFLSDNQWVKNYLPNMSINSKIPTQPVKYSARSCIIFDKVIGFIDLFFFKFQKWWMKKKITNEKIQADLIAFHPKDLSKSVLKEYRKRVKTI